MLKDRVYLRQLDYSKILELAHKRNNKNFAVNNEYYYSDEHIKQAIDAHLKINLNYDTKTGITRYGKEIMAYYSNSKDVPKYENTDDIIQWQFLNFIMNSAGRLKRGYEVIG